MKKILFTFVTTIVTLLLSSCSVSKFYVQYLDENGDVQFVEQVHYGDKLTPPQENINEGYTFLGWYCDGVKWDFEKDKVKKNIQLQPIWQVNSYEIKMIVNDKYDIRSIYAEFGSRVILPKPEMKDFQFNRWTINGEFINLTFDMPANDMTIVAAWDYGSKGWTINQNRLVKYKSDATIFVVPTFYAIGTATGAELRYIYTIGSGAFSENQTIEEIFIQEGITKIEGTAFFGCNNLKRIILPNTLKEINNWAFYALPSLEYIVIPESVEKINGYALMLCDKTMVYTECEVIPPGWYNDFVNYTKIYLKGEWEYNEMGEPVPLIEK